MLRVGVIGLGVMGQHHVRLYSKFQNLKLETDSATVILEASKSEPEGFQCGGGELATRNSKLSTGIQLVGVADANPERAREIGEKYAVEYFTDYHELISRVDAVSIAVPTSLHHIVALNFLEAGVHCLVEKPIASSLKEAREMIHTAKKHNANLAVGHIEHFNPAVIALKEIIEKGTLGKILIISTRRVGPYVPRIRDVGIVIDSATHDIGVVKYLTGKGPVSVFSRVGSLKHPKEDHAIIALDFGGTLANIEVNWFTPHKVRTLVATGSEGIASLDYIDQTLIIHNSQSEEVVIEKAEPLRLELEDFLNSIRYGTHPKVNGAEGLEILKIALEASVNNYIGV